MSPHRRYSPFVRSLSPSIRTLFARSMGRCGMAAAILVHFGHGLFLPSTPDRACQASGAVAGDEDDVRPFAPDHPALEAARAIAGSAPAAGGYGLGGMRSEEHTSELQSLMRLS